MTDRSVIMFMETRERILEAAFGLFAERGFGEARVEDVAARAGLGKGTVYLHFASKKELFKVSVAHQLAPAAAALEEVALEGEPGEALGQLYGRLAGFIDTGRPGEVFRLIISESARFPELAEAYHRETLSPIMERLVAIAERWTGPAKGEERRPLRRHPQLLLAPVFMAALWQVVFRDIQALDTSSFLEAYREIVAAHLEGGGGSHEEA